MVFNLDADSDFQLVSTVATADTLIITPYNVAGTTFAGTITSADLTAARTWTFPDDTGTICISTGNCSGSGLWANTDEVFHPRDEFASVVDLVIGGDSTTSGKFQVYADTGNVQMDGNLTVDGGNIIGAATTNLLNAATTVNLGSTNIARAINIGTGTDVDTISIGTGAGLDVIAIGGGTGTLDISQVTRGTSTKPPSSSRI